MSEAMLSKSLIQFSVDGWGCVPFLLFTSLVAQMVKPLPAMGKTQVRSLGQEDPLGKGMATTPLFLPGELLGQRSLVGYSPWGCKESDMTEQHHFLNYGGGNENNGELLQKIP